MDHYIEEEEEVVHPSAAADESKAVVAGVTLDTESGMYLLAWAVRFAARPGDSIVAVHVLRPSGDGEDGSAGEKAKARRAKAAVISMLAEFAEGCQAKGVKLEAKVKRCRCVGRALADEAATVGATVVLVGGGSGIGSFEIAKRCFKHAPEGCLAVAMGKKGSRGSRGVPTNKLTVGLDSSARARGVAAAGGVCGVGARSPRLLDLFSSKPNSKRTSSSSGGKGSPRAVLDGPESRPSAPPPAEDEDCSTPSSNAASRDSNGGSGIWRRISTVRSLFSFLGSPSAADSGGKDDAAGDDDGKEERRRPSWRCFGYEDISRATESFHPGNIVGRGGYAEVYKGILYNRKPVAVKRLASGTTDENKEREFLAELGILGHVCHPNIACLVGCCIENGLHLIFDYYPDGNLASTLHSSGENSVLLEWPARYKVAVGVARGLNYLHKGCRRRIIHRDIKASNILLGPHYEPKISDFGLAKWLPKQWSHHSVTPIEGTFGYLAPEYFMHGVVDEKTDVFAYGVLLLEIIAGRRPVDSLKQSLLLWAKPLMDSGKAAEMVDPRLDGEFDESQLRRLALVASYCIRRSPAWRPTMSEVLDLLVDEEGQRSADGWRAVPGSWQIEMDEDGSNAELVY